MQWFQASAVTLGALAMSSALGLAQPTAPQDTVPAGDATAIAPTPVENGIATVRAGALRRGGPYGAFSIDFVPEAARADLPAVGPAFTGPVAKALHRLNARGRTAGLADVLYDNRDRGHSMIDLRRFPQLNRTAYDDTAKAQALDHNIAGKVFFNLPVVGNSSTAWTAGPLARSLGRMALSEPALIGRAHALYRGNHAYVYPEHKDYDPETGDRLFLNAPFFLLSQGSSYSDKPFVDALLFGLSALRPDTRAMLEARGLLVPTLFMALRRTLQGVNSDAGYLSAKAHAPVLPQGRLRVAAMMAYLNSLAPDDVPPAVDLTLVAPPTARPGFDYLATNLDEVLVASPDAIALAWRSFDFTRSFTISAADTVDPNGRSVTFHWVLLQGDPERVRITPLDATGSAARIEMDWHPPFQTGPNSGLQTTRVDIGVFADNGRAVSAPAMVSVNFPGFQNRVYARALDGTQRLASLDYAAALDDPYADPLIWPTADWQDQLIWSDTGRLTGIVRRLDGEAGITLARGLTGYLQKTDAGGHQVVRHAAARSRKGPLELVAEGLTRPDRTDQ